MIIPAFQLRVTPQTIMQSERQAPATQFVSFKATRIPSDQPQDQVQRIFGCHYPGALICLKKQKSRKSDFRSGHLTIPRNVVDNDQTLQRALSSNDGVAIFPSPLPKIYLRPLVPEKAPDSAPLASFQKQIQEMQLKHQQEIHSLNDKIEGLHSNYLTVVAEVNKIVEYLNSQAAVNGNLMPQIQQSVQQYAVPLQHYNLKRDHSRR